MSIAQTSSPPASPPPMFPSGGDTSLPSPASQAAQDMTARSSEAGVALILLLSLASGQGQQVDTRA